MTLGFLTEDGPRPGFAELYGGEGDDNAGLPDADQGQRPPGRRSALVRRTDTPGAKATLHAIRGMGKPHML